MPIPPPLLKGSRRDYTLGRLVEMTPADATMPAERKLLGLVLPPWQRPEVWTVDQKRRFIEGVFLGLGCGFYVTNGLEWVDSGASAPMSGWLIDGQQRISAVRDFLRGDLVVFGDVRFPELTKPEQLRFCRVPFPCVELEYCDDENTLLELYDRMNFGGTAHSPEQRVEPPFHPSARHG